MHNSVEEVKQWPDARRLIHLACMQRNCKISNPPSSSNALVRFLGPPYCLHALPGQPTFLTGMLINSTCSPDEFTAAPY